MYFENLQCSPYYALPLLLNADGKEHKYNNKTEYDIFDSRFLEDMLSKYLNSPDAAHKTTCDRYRQGINDITGKARYVVSSKGTLTTSPVLSDNRICHSFFNLLVEQKVSLLLSREITVVGDDNVELSYGFKETLREVCNDSLVYGIGYIYVNGVGEIERLNPLECLPIWKDREKTVMQGLIHYYKVMTYNENRQFIEKKCVDVYNPVRIDKYIEDDHSKLIYQNSEPYFIDAEGMVVEVGLPVIPVLYHSGKSLLNDIKPLIDSYDKVTSGLANAIEDVPNSIKVIKGYSGQDKDLFTQNLAQYRIAFVDEDGGIDNMETPLNIVEQEAFLKAVKADIFALGMGVDTTNDDLGNTSGVALRYRYASLISDVEKWSKSVEWALKRVFALFGIEVDFIFNLDNSVLESAIIEDIKNSVGLLSNRTLIEMHPYISDVDGELARLAQEQVETSLYVRGD